MAGLNCWEPGSNNEFKYERLKNELKHRKDGHYEKFRYEYDQNTKEITLHFHWNH